MAEAERSNKTPTSQRRPYQQRSNHPNRGRGRPDPHVSKALHFFGVPDLREWLDKKHEHQGQSKDGGPPPDPSFNYLKDPLRENVHYEHQTRKQHKEHPEREVDSWSKGHTPKGSRGRGSGSTNRDERRSETEKVSFIQNPINIKVELSTKTGERSYKLDEETKLADIKHVPDRKQEWRSFRPDKNKSDEKTKSSDSKQYPDRQRHERNSFRGEKFTEPKHLPEQQERRFSKGEKGRNVHETGGGWGARDEGQRDNREYGRGRSERGRGWRGRGGRGSGHAKPQGRYNPNTNKKLNSNLPPNIITTEVPTDEDWDHECVDPPVTGTDDGNMKNKDQEENKNQEETLQYQEEQFEEEVPEDEEYLEAGEEIYDEAHLGDEDHPEAGHETEIKVEENLVISSVVEKNEEIGKRTVRFKIDDEEKKGGNDNNMPEKQTEGEELQNEEIRSEDKPDEKAVEDKESNTIGEKKDKHLDKDHSVKNVTEMSQLKEASTENLDNEKE